MMLFSATLNAKMDGMEVLAKILAAKPDVPVVMISGHGTIETAVDALKKGAYDYISKPPDLNRCRTVRKRSKRIPRKEQRR
jgi:DNA-binding NtrC family response regulator